MKFIFIRANKENNNFSFFVFIKHFKTDLRVGKFLGADSFLILKLLINDHTLLVLPSVLRLDTYF
jgi:hypothetical protein